MKKQLLSTLLTLCMVLALLPVTALAAETSGSCGDNITFSFSDGTLIIQGTGSMDDYAYLISNNNNAPWFDYRAEIHTLNIGNGVTRIGDSTFRDCVNLTSVTIPNGVTSIGNRAFYSCRALTDVYYGGSESQWKQLKYGEENVGLLTATIHYNSTGPDNAGSGGAAPAEPEQPAAPSAPVPTSVVLSPQGLRVDGKDIQCEKYNIDGRNYFKLRDLAKLLSETGSRFEVGYDEATATVTITTGQAYTPNGTELLENVDNSASAVPSSQAIVINGEKNDKLTVYNIGGSNFFQLRELGSVLGFEVDFDGDANTAIVRSAQK